MTWRIGVEKNMFDLDLQIEIVENQNEWRGRIHMKDYWNWYAGSCSRPQSFGIKAPALLLLYASIHVEVWTGGSDIGVWGKMKSQCNIVARRITSSEF